MFKKLKDKLEEEFKQGPLKLPVSVQQLAQVISPSPSLNSLSDNNANSSITNSCDPSSVSTEFFTIGDDDESSDGTVKTLPLHSVDLTASSPSNMTQNRSRRSSLSSVTSEGPSLFPIYENPVNQNSFQSDLESEMEDGVPSQIEKISKEQIYQSYKKIFNHYNKYKSRYVDLIRQYKELQHENVKTKNVLQESQDKALRRISELKEQCQLEQNAKAHLEESLRSDVEDRDHMITTLKTKISLLTSGGDNDSLLIDANEKNDSDISGVKKNFDEIEKLKSENENLLKEVNDLKQLKETACHLIHRCDTTIDEATEDVNNENLKRKMSELKSEIQKMKSENESLSHLLSRNLTTEEDKKVHGNSENNLLIDLSHVDSSQTEEKDKKIEKLNNLLLKCKEKINSLTAEIKSKNLIIEDKNKRMKELSDELKCSKKSISSLTSELKTLKVMEEENVIMVAENKMAIHQELETKEEQIRALTKELKTLENEFQKEKDELVAKYENEIKCLTENFTGELKSKNEELKAKMEIISQLNNDDSSEKVKKWEMEFKEIFDVVRNGQYYANVMEKKHEDIERACLRLEERIINTEKKLVSFIFSKQAEVESKHCKCKSLEESQNKRVEDVRTEANGKHESNLENLNLEIRNLTMKVEEQKAELADAQNKNEEYEKERLKIINEREKLKCDLENVNKLSDTITNFELELEKMKNEYSNAAAENKKLNDELNNQKGKLKSAEHDSCLLKKIKLEKTEAEKKLSDYIENYKILEKENHLLESELNKKSDKLMKDLNDSKEKIKSLENENKMMSIKIAGLNNDLAKAMEDRSKISVEHDEIKLEMQELLRKLKIMEGCREECDKLVSANEELNGKCDRALSELDFVRSENLTEKKEKALLEKENVKLKNEMKFVEEKLKEITLRNSESERHLKEQMNLTANELEMIKNQLSEQKNLSDKLECELKINQKLRKEVEEKESLKSKVDEFKLKYEEEKILNEKLRESCVKCDELKKEIVRLNEEKLVSISADVSKLAAKNEETWEELNNLQSALTKEKSKSEKLMADLSEGEKARSELTEKMEELLMEKNEAAAELEALRNNFDSSKQELTMRIKELGDEKICLATENENKLNILKNEIKYLNNKFEEDIANIEENRNIEVSELNLKLEIAEKTSNELLKKLEKVTAERDEAKASLEEKNLKISEAESCVASRKLGLDEKIRQGKENNAPEEKGEEVKQLIAGEEDIRFPAEKLEESAQTVEKSKFTNQRLKTAGSETSLQNVHSEEGIKSNPNEEVEEEEEKETSTNVDAQGVNVGESEIFGRESKQLLCAEKESKMELPAASQSVESIKKELIQQAEEMKELKKQHKREVAELRKIIAARRKSRRNSIEGSDWGGTLDNDTEYEYLRNILYEYMMGREQLVLAKVLSAIVKFDKQQTRNVLEKERHRQTLLGIL